MEDVKTLLFGRWIAMCYSSSDMNNNDGYWWKDRLADFNNIVYPEYIKNGTVDDHKRFLDNSDIIMGVLNDLP